jgi:hypothetical protein
MRTVATILGTLFVGTVPLLAQVPPAGVAGTWEVEDTPFSIVLDVKDGAVSGQLVQNANKTAIAEGTVSGDTVTFRATSPDGARTVTFVGKLTGDEMLFTREVEMREGAPLGGAGLMGANGPTEFRARRASPASEVWTGTVRNAPTPRPGDEIECDLTRRSEGDFAGRCQATAGAGPNLLIELAPPGQPAPETMR